MNIEELVRVILRRKKLPKEEVGLLLRYSYVVGVINKKRYSAFLKKQKAEELKKEEFVKEVVEPLGSLLSEVLQGITSSVLEEGKKGRKSIEQKLKRFKVKPESGFIRFTHTLKLIENAVSQLPTTQRIFYEEVLERTRAILGEIEWLKSIDEGSMGRLKVKMRVFLNALKKGNVTLALAHSKEILERVQYSSMMVEVNRKIWENLKALESLEGVPLKKEKRIREILKALSKGSIDVKTYLHRRQRLVKELGDELFGEEKTYILENRISPTELEEVVTVVSPLVSGSQVNLSGRESVLAYIAEKRDEIPYEDYAPFVLFALQPFTSLNKINDLKRIQLLRWELGDLYPAGGETEDIFRAYIRSMMLILEGDLKGTARAESFFDTLKTIKTEGLNNAWKRLSERVEVIEKSTRALKESGIETPQEMMDSLAELKEALANEPSTPLLEQVNRTVKELEDQLKGLLKGKEDVLIRDKAEELLASLKSLKAEGVEVESILDRVNETLARETYSDPLKELVNIYTIEKQIEEMEREVREEKLKNMKREIENRIREAKESGLDVSEEEEGLRRIEKNWNKWDMERISKELQALNYTLMNRWMKTKKEDLKKQIETLKMEASSVDTSLDLSETMSLLSEAEKMFEKNQFDFADTYLRRAQETLEMNRKMLLSESSFSRLNTLKEELEILKDTGADVFEVEELLMEAESLLMNENYEKAFSTLKEVDSRFSTLREHYLNVYLPEQIEKLKRTTETLTSMGIPSTFLNSRLKELEESVKMGDLRGSLMLLKDLKGSVERAYLSDNVVALPERLLRLREMKDRLRQEGVAIEDVEALLDEAQRLLGAEDFEGAKELTDRVEGILKEREASFYRESFDSLKEQTRKMLERIEREGLEVKIPELEMNLALDSYDKGDYLRAYQLMKGVAKYLEGEYKRHYFSQRKQSMFKQMEEIRRSAEDLPAEYRKRLEAEMEEVEKRLLLDDLDGAEKALRGVEEVLDSGVRERRVEALKRNVQTMRALIKRLQDAGVDMGRAPELLGTIEREIENGNVERAEELSEELQHYLTTERAGMMEENLRGELINLERRVQVLKREGVDVDYVARVLNKVKENLERGEVEEASRNLAEASEIVEASERVLKERGFRQTVEKIERLIQDIRDAGGETPEEELLAKAVELYENGEVEEAEEMAERILKTLHERWMNAMQERFTNTISALLRDMAVLREEGLEVEEMEMRIKEATESFEKGDVEESFKILDELTSILNEIKKAKELGGVKREVERILEGLRYYEERRGKLPKRLREVKQRIEEAISTEDEVEMRGAMEELLNSVGMMKEKTQVAVAKNLKRFCTAHVAEIEAEGETAERLSEGIKKLNELIETKRYPEAILEGMRTLGDLIHLKRQMAVEKEFKTLRSLRKTLEELRGEGYGVSVIETILTQAEVELQEGRYERAKRLIKKGSNLIKELNLKMKLEKAKEAIDWAEALIRYLKDNFVGISSHLKKPEEYLKKARDAFVRKKYRTAEKYAVKARELIESNPSLNLEQFLYVFYTLHINEKIRRYLEQLEGMKEHVSGVQELINDLKSLKEDLERGMDPTIGEMKLKEIRSKIRNLEERAQKNEAFEMLNDLYKKLQPHLKKKEKKFREAIKYYNLAKEAFSYQEYPKVVLYTKKAQFLLKRALAEERGR